MALPVDLLGLAGNCAAGFAHDLSGDTGGVSENFVAPCAVR
jgi:hypothetical protein